MSFSDFAMGRKPVLQTLDWLADDLLRVVRERLNAPLVRARLGLFNGEVIPSNERNLIDTRTRVSLIYEYLLADTISELLLETGGGEFCAYVVANRFPDLEIRDRHGNRGVRLEVKCLQSTAEEKAANFSTLIKDIDRDHDFLIVFLWEWSYDAADVRWDRAPLLLDSFAFSAQALARLRDWNWLNRPSARQGRAYQGFDIRGAVTSNSDVYKEEEGNYGKLLRLWDSGFALRPPMNPLMVRTEADFVRFRQIALHSGFESLSRTILQSVVDEAELRPVTFEGAAIGFRRGRHWFILSSSIATDRLVALMRREGAQDVIVFTDKYTWRHCALNGGRLRNVTDWDKPKRLQTYLDSLHVNRPGAG
jgi:hypothetical protein